MSRGQLVPGRHDRARLPRSSRGRRRRKGAILDGFPRTKVQAEALDAALAEAGRRVDRAAYIDVPLEDLVKRMANRRICTANGHVYNLVSNPPPSTRICDLDGSEPRPASRTTPEATVRARMAQQVPPLLDVVEHYRDKGILTTVDGRQAIDDGHRGADVGPARRRCRLTMVTRKSRAEIERMRRAGRVVGEVLDHHRGRDCARASRPPISTPSPRPTSGRPARHRRSRATPGSTRAGRSRPASASRSTTRSSTASRASGRSAPARSCRSMPGRSSTAGMATRRGRSTSASRRRRSPSSST